MKKLGLLLLFGFISNGNLMYAYDEHQAETKFLEKEWNKVKQESEELRKCAQELVMIVVKEKMRIAEEANMRIQASSSVPTVAVTEKNEELVQKIASEDELKNDEIKIASENNNNAQVVPPAEIKRVLTKKEWAQRMISENKKEAIVIGVTGVAIVGGAVLYGIKTFSGRQ